MPTTEERLAALEKQMAAWIAQQPTTYYTHKYSGEEIDDAVDKIRSGAGEGAVRFDQAQALTPAQQSQAQANIGTTWPCNPNLLDNWYFRRPVNQMGQTEYTGNVYYIDRWRSWDGDSASLSVVSGGIKTAGTLYQYFEPAVFEELWGKTVAISLLLADGTLYTDYFALKRADWYTVPIKAHGLDVVQFGINNNNFGNQNNNFLRVQPATIGTLSDTILAAKLELGPTQTLAHREGDKWVLNEVPDYGDQLRRCLRCCRVDDFTDSYTVAAFGVAVSETYWRGFLPSYSDMRTKPTIAIIGDNPSVQLIGNGQSINIAGLVPTVISAKTTGTAIGFNGVSGLVANQTYALQLYRCKIIRSADL